MKSAIFKALIIGLTTVGLAGCDDQAGQSPGSPIVDITITESNSGAITITVDPYELDLTGRPENQPLTFKLTSSKFRYVTNPEEAIDIPNDPNNQFTGHTRGPQGKMMVVHNKNKDGIRHQYILRVVDDTGRRIELDPLIKNGL